MASSNPWVSLRWEKNTRYYEAHLKHDLFGWVIARNWGGIGQASGRRLTIPIDTYENGVLALEKIQARRQQRQYSLCGRA